MGESPQQTIVDLHDQVEQLRDQRSRGLVEINYLNQCVDILAQGLQCNITLYEAMAREAHDKGDHHWSASCVRAADSNRKILYSLRKGRS